MAIEFWGLCDGQVLAINLSIRKLIIEINATIVVTILTFHDNQAIMSHPCSVLILDFRSLLQLFEEGHIHHTYCEGNHCADLLAKEGYSSTGNFALYLQPSSCILY